MQMSRSSVVTAAVAAAAALAATGVTYAAADSAPEAAPAAAAAAPFGGGTGNNNNGNNNNGKGNEGGHEGGHGGRRHFEGRILVNERSYSSHPGDCITVVSGLGAKSLNVRNDSDKTVELFRGAVCDNGAPIATVGPWSQSDGVRVHNPEGIEVKHGVVGSFRVVCDHRGERGGHEGEGGEWGGDWGGEN
ncbi:hypothetical protein BFF78_22830 [Streptomyces fodineus]|uniref:Secreted protein n=1 Tax=Streptomyces fodineus TaxID=1904616 RepID=A0A1D7YD12_9ACTN|nr:hypothetical protein [Streptomyces fodineus]AOR33518.1 hypothetical protein BFF78_22830 [Streptomyces fodineus]